MFVLYGFVLAALMEYLLHRYYLHLPKHPHIYHHHQIFLKEFENSSIGAKDIVSKPTYIFMSSILALMLTLILFPSKGFLVLWIYGSALLYLAWVELVHFLFHSPQGYKIESFTLFQLLKEHHHEHHLKFKINYGIGSTFIDHILRTKY